MGNRHECVLGIQYVYGGRSLSHYRKAVRKALKNGPKARFELVGELCPIIMSEKKLQNTLNELVDEGVLVKKRKRTDDTYRELTYYALRRHRYLLEVELGQVVKALKYLRLELCRNPEVEEVAAKIDKDPESVLKILFEHATELRWKPPTPEEKEEAKKLRMQARKLAARIKFSFDGEISLSEVSMEAIKNAECLLERQFNSIKEEDIDSSGLVLFPRSPAPPSPKERDKKEAIDTIKKLRNLKKLER